MQEKVLLPIKIMSFGYKYGMVEDANFVQDVRFLPNPYYDAELKSENGLKKEVQDYVKGTAEAKNYISALKSFCELYIAEFINSERPELTIAIGCTGGRHRSVTVACEIYNYLIEKGYTVSVAHRDIFKDNQTCQYPNTF